MIAKIDIISGFLGAGKTTLIKKLLKEAFAGEQVVLIENEFGEIGIDGGFLKDAGIEIREMNQGCICCSLVGNFAISLKEVVETYHPDRILIEPSGVGKLSDVMKAVKDIEGYTDIKLNSYTTVVDAKKCKMYTKNFGEFFNNQIENAGAIIMSRTDIVDEKKAMEAMEILRELNEKAAIITTPIDKLDGKKLLEVMEHPVALEDEVMKEEICPECGHVHHHHHHHDDECCCGHDHEEHEHAHHEHHHHDDECCCGHDHEEHEHEHHEHHHHDDECCCGHDHEEHEHEHHEHHHHDDECCCGHDHEEHEHEHHEHHHHDDECCCGHDHEEHEHAHHEHHHHDDECCCGHDHEEHEHAHHEHHHHDHDDDCDCGCHDHDHHEHHHHHHHADEVFTSWGRETVKKYTREGLEKILAALSESEEYGIILRSKGMLPAEDGTWIYFDMVPEEAEIREGSPEYTGRLCVIGSKLNEAKLEELFGLA